MMPLLTRSVVAGPKKTRKRVERKKEIVSEKRTHFGHIGDEHSKREKGTNGMMDVKESDNIERDLKNIIYKKSFEVGIVNVTEEHNCTYELSIHHDKYIAAYL